MGASLRARFAGVAAGSGACAWSGRRQVSKARTRRRKGSGPTEPHRHLLVDLSECPPERLRDGDLIREAMLAAAREAGATVVDQTFHHFEGGGVTGVVAVQESHLTIHTWPEHGYAAVDVFLCGAATRPRVAADLLAARLGAGQVRITEQHRGHARPAPAATRAPGPSAAPLMPLLYGITIVVALCSIVYELLLAQTLSAILGNTVLRYSITIGCYLGALGVGALLCGSDPPDPVRRLVRVEVALSAIGGVAVPLFYFLDAGHRMMFLTTPVGSMWDWAAPLGFLAATHAVILLIGLLSGFEVPLLLRLGEQLRPASTNRVLGVDYFGALLGSVLFPLFFLRTLGLLATGFVVALLNAVAAAVLIVSWRPARPGRAYAALALVAVLSVAGLAKADAIEQYFLKKFYFFDQITSVGDLLRPQTDLARIERYRSPYQTIDLVRQAQDGQWVYDAVTKRLGDPAAYPRDLWLYLDRDYQLYSGSDEIYHEWFVHAPIQVAGRAPRRVAVIGGGDGLAIRELLAYDALERLVHVELDPQMLRLAREHPILSVMNGHVHDDPRVEVVLGDAFQWLRTTGERFDAIFVDVPRARDYNLAMLYSREFYAMVRAHLGPGGFLAFDAPDGSCGAGDDSGWRIYYSTLRSAGFRTVRSLVSRFDEQTRAIADTATRFARDVHMDVELPGGGTAPMTERQRRQYLREAMLQWLGQSTQEFIVAFPDRRPVEPSWSDLGVEHRALTPHLLRLAFPGNCPKVADPALVNSVFRPTLPQIWWLAVPTA